MSAEFQDDGALGSPVGPTVPAGEPAARARPNVSGDLPTVFQAAPMFKRAVAGYDRFQVDTYVQWAEDELATADREREHLMARHLGTVAALEEARGLLAHSSGGVEFLQVSRRIGSMLAAAADQAEGMRADAEADRAAAAAEAQEVVAEAERVLADAQARAEQAVAEAATRVAEMIADAGRIVDEAARTRSAARAEAEARLAEVRATEQRAVEQAARIRQRAEAEASVARLQARDEIVRMLSTGREQRRRADAEAAATRERLQQDAVTRAAALLAEVAALEQRRAALRAEVELPADPVVGRSAVPLSRLLERFRWRPGFLRAP